MRTISHLSQFFSNANLPEAVVQMQAEARLIFREDAGLQRPKAVRLGSLDQRVQQKRTDAMAACWRADVNADLSDTGINASARNRTERRPTNDLIIRTRNNAARIEFRFAPFFP